jgi:hypothetical protein
VGRHRQQPGIVEDSFELTHRGILRKPELDTAVADFGHAGQGTGQVGGDLLAQSPQLYSYRSLGHDLSPDWV